MKTRDADQTYAFLKHVLDPTIGVVEVRCPDARIDYRNQKIGPASTKGVVAGWFDNAHDLVGSLERLDGASAFTTINPVNPALLARISNRLDSAKATSKDEDVICWRNLLLDIDAKRPTGIPSTDVELAEAVFTRDAIFEHVPGLRECSFWGCSGNGVFVVPRLPDYPNTPEYKALVAEFIDVLKAKFDGDTVKIDEQAKNQSRIMALPGTLKCKGDGTADRPRRMVTIDSPPGERSSFDLVAWMNANRLATPTAAVPPEPERDRKPAKSRAGTSTGDGGHSRARADYSAADWQFVLEKRVPAYVDKVDPAISGSDGHDTAFDAAIKVARGFDLTVAEAVQALDSWNRRCQPPWSDADLLHKIEDALAKPGDRGWHLSQPVSSSGAANAQEAEGKTVLDRVRVYVEAGDTQGLYKDTALLNDIVLVNGSDPGIYAGIEDLVTSKLKTAGLSTFRAAIKGFLKRTRDSRRRPPSPSSYGMGPAPPHPPEGDVLNGPELDRLLVGFECTDTGNSDRLIARFGRDLRYCHSWETWLVWDGCRWAIDPTGRIVELAKQTARAILLEAHTIADEEERELRISWAYASQSSARIAAMIGLAESIEGVAIEHTELNRDPWAFNCQNGTLDLRTGTLRPHRRADLITQLCPFDFDPAAKCPLWDQTLETFFHREDADLQKAITGFWQKLCGYAMTAVSTEHILPIAYGNGSNGKSTMLEMLMHTFGPDYAGIAPENLLMMKRFDTHPTELADLYGKRLIVAIETDEGRRLNESRVKVLCDGSPIKARRMQENFWQFTPTHTLFLASNHRPKVTGTDHGIWRRLKLVPFTVTMPDGQAEKKVPLRLRGESEGERAEYPGEQAGVLAWCVRGCLAWQKSGLNPPEEVTAATDNYRRDQDLIGNFLEEATISVPGSRVKAGVLYGAYKTWAGEIGETPISQRTFGEAVAGKGIKKSEPSNGFKYLDLSMRAHREPSGPLPEADPEVDYGTF